MQHRKGDLVWVHARWVGCLGHGWGMESNFWWAKRQRGLGMGQHSVLGSEEQRLCLEQIPTAIRILPSKTQETNSKDYQPSQQAKGNEGEWVWHSRFETQGKERKNPYGDWGWWGRRKEETPQRMQQSKRQPMIWRTRKSMNQRAKPEATAQSESRRIRSNSQKRRQQNWKGEGKPMSTTTQKQEQGPAPTDLSRPRCCMQHGREGCKRFWTLSSWSKMSQGTTSMKCLDLGWQHSARVAWMCTGAGQQLVWHAGQKRLMWATLAVQPRTAHGLSEWQQHLKQQKCLQLAGTNLVLPIVFLERNSSSNP